MNKPRPESSEPRCIVIAGPNGAGKTTFARDFLTKEAGVVNFINADLIATGLSPLKPDAAALAAGRVFLSELDRLTRARESFAFESTLAGVSHAGRLRRMKRADYLIGDRLSENCHITARLASHCFASEAGWAPCPAC